MANLLLYVLASCTASDVRSKMKIVLEKICLIVSLCCPSNEGDRQAHFRIGSPKSLVKWYTVHTIFGKSSNPPFLFLSLQVLLTISLIFFNHFS